MTTPTPHTVHLTRSASTDTGTFGVLIAYTGFKCVTLELPWRNNLADKSCIPVGTYQVSMRWSPKHNCRVYGLLNVPGHTDVEIHSANWGGDIDKGYYSELLGCIALGQQQAQIQTPLGKMQLGITSSVTTVQAFRLSLNNQDFTLVIS